MKRILCILSSLDAGGAETFVMKVLRVLPSDRVRIDFIVSVEGGCYTQEVLARGGRIYKIPLRTQNFRGAFNGIRRVVRDNGYEFVFKLAENSLSVADLIAARMGGAKVLAIRSCNAPTGMPLRGRCIHKAMQPLLNCVSTVKIAPSMLAAEYMFGKRKARTQVSLLKNAVDLNVFRFDPTGRQRIRSEFSVGESLLVGHVGRLCEQKNHRYLLDVFLQVKNRRKDALLLLIGIGELERVIRERVEELGLSDSVIFAGRRFDVPDLLSAMDVFVFPSFYEGMPNAVIEAQAAGLPCVISDAITKEANITGLVSYLPLGSDPCVWAETAVSMSASDREDKRADFLRHGYEISAVADEFLSLVIGDEGRW